MIENMKNPARKHLIGIDEVGRGPLAGPVAVGAVKLKVNLPATANRSKGAVGRWQAGSEKLKVGWGRGFRDSKKLSAKGREAWMVKIDKAQSEGWLEYAVAFVPPSVIDKKGLSYAIQTALDRALECVNPVKQLGNETPKLEEVKVLLDGGLRAGAHYKNQRTIIKGDEKELVIALASIVAKVTRDAWMVKLGKRFPQYGFEKHKGYGTRAHYVAIKEYGITKHHRKSFLKGVMVKDS